MATDKDITSGELMLFLQNFQRKMEDKMEDTKITIEKTNRIIDGRLDVIDSEVQKVNTKIAENEGENEEINRRMDARLIALEAEIKRSGKLGRRSNELRNLERNLDGKSSESRKDSKTRGCFQMADELDENGGKVEEITKAILNEPIGTFRSSWAQGMQKELELAAKEANKKKNGCWEDSF